MSRGEFHLTFWGSVLNTDAKKREYKPDADSFGNNVCYKKEDKAA